MGTISADDDFLTGTDAIGRLGFAINVEFMSYSLNTL